MELFAKLFPSLLVFVYHCFDRIVIHGYLSGLSRPEQVVYFFRDVIGVPVVDKTVLGVASHVPAHEPGNLSASTGAQRIQVLRLDLGANPVVRKRQYRIFAAAHMVSIPTGKDDDIPGSSSTCCPSNIATTDRPSMSKWKGTM
jgi:hypothetical protein